MLGSYQDDRNDTVYPDGAEITMGFQAAWKDGSKDVQIHGGLLKRHHLS
jgi:hypothetical protein